MDKESYHWARWVFHDDSVSVWEPVMVRGNQVYEIQEDESNHVSCYEIGPEITPPDDNK